MFSICNFHQNTLCVSSRPNKHVDSISLLITHEKSRHHLHSRFDQIFSLCFAAPCSWQEGWCKQNHGWQSFVSLLVNPSLPLFFFFLLFCFSSHALTHTQSELFKPVKFPVRAPRNSKLSNHKAAAAAVVSITLSWSSCWCLYPNKWAQMLKYPGSSSSFSFIFSLFLTLPLMHTHSFIISSPSHTHGVLIAVFSHYSMSLKSSVSNIVGWRVMYFSIGSIWGCTWYVFEERTNLLSSVLSWTPAGCNLV